MLTGKTIGQLTLLETPTSNTLIPVELDEQTYHIVFSSITTFFDVTYSELYDKITGATLSIGGYYKITDYKTCYDQPNFNYNGSSITEGNYKDDSPVEPIIVFATSSNTISDQAYQPNYPNDKIRYDWAFNQTDITQGVAFGRITERIDEYNNRTDYDHRQIKFIRYRYYENQLSNPYAGTVNVTSISDTEMGVTGFGTTFEDLSVGTIVGFGRILDFKVYTITNIDSDTEMTVTGFTTSNANNLRMYQTNWSEYSSYYQNNIETSYEEYFTFNLDGNSINNFIGNYSNIHIFDGLGSFLLANNVFQSQFYNNRFGDGCYNNTFFDDCWNNMIGNYFSNNITDDDFDGNFIGNVFTNNYITSNFQYNRIGEGFEGNYIVQNDFYRNNIMNNFQYNNISGGDFQNNEIGSQFSNNIIDGDFYKNDVGNGYNDNEIYSENYGNLVGNGFNQNEIFASFRENTIGDYFQGNIIHSILQRNRIGVSFSNNNLSDSGNTGSFYFEANSILNDFNANTIVGDFRFNNILSYFNNNNIQDGFGFGGSNARGNTIGNYFQSNNIGEYFYDNVIGDNFDDNEVYDSFQLNYIKTSVVGTNFIENLGNITAFTYVATGNTATDNIYTDLTGTTNELGLNATFGVEVSGGTVVSVTGSSFGIKYQVSDNITILGSSIGGSDGVDDVIIVVTGISPLPSVYGYYNCEIFKNSDNSNRLSFYDSSDILTIKDINL